MRVDKSKWHKCKLEDLCTNGSSNIVISKVEIGKGNYPLYGASGIIGNIVFYHQDKEYVGVVKDGSGVGRVAKYPAYSSLVGTMQYIFPKDNANIDYLRYLLESLNLAKYVKGAAIPHIYFRHYKTEQTFLPPLIEQQAIAAELDAVQAMIDGYKAQIADLDALAQSIFLDMFGDPTINSKGWEILKIGEICEVTSSKRIYQSEQTKSGIPFYKISDFPNLIEYGYSDTEIFISQAKYEELKLQKLVPNKNDLLITSRGTLGLCYIVKDGDRFYFQDGMITWLRNLKPTVLSAFLGFMFQSSLFKNQIEKAQNGSTIAYLSISMIRKFDMIVPPIKLQQHFATQVEVIEQQKELLRQQLADAETLMTERMQYYFS